MKNPATAVLYCVVFVGLMCGMANAYCIGPRICMGGKINGELHCEMWYRSTN